MRAFCCSRAYGSSGHVPEMSRDGEARWRCPRSARLPAMSSGSTAGVARCGSRSTGRRTAATKGEGRQNMLCAYLAAALLVGLLANAAFGAWWLDPLVGLLIAGVAVKEGLDAWRGEGCCVNWPLGSDAFAQDDCSAPDADCCR